jgi:hypothetical protein
VIVGDEDSKHAQASPPEPRDQERQVSRKPLETNSV